MILEKKILPPTKSWQLNSNIYPLKANQLGYVDQDSETIDFLLMSLKFEKPCF